MKKTYLLLVMPLFVLSSLFTSCVSNKKFMASEASVNKLQIANASTLSQLNDCNMQVKKLYAEKEALKSADSIVQNDLKGLNTESKLTIADQAKRLKTLQDVIQGQKNLMENIKKSIADALLNYSKDELSVNIRNGNVYVSLEEKLLFKSGSDVVAPKGKDALKSLAKVLSNTKDITVLIEGYTDNVPIKTKQFEDNWDLSTARATSIVRILTKDYGFDPNRITASGRGQFHPVKSNNTEAGRAGNRRTEIILSPDLKELFRIMNE